jgi:hypothetical protein
MSGAWVSGAVPVQSVVDMVPVEDKFMIVTKIELYNYSVCMN